MQHHVTADHGSYAAGRDLTIHNHCAVKPCPLCEQRIITLQARSCRRCRRRRAWRMLWRRILRKRAD